MICYLISLHWLYTENINFWEELTPYFLSIWHGSHRKRNIRENTQAHRQQDGLISPLTKIKEDTQIHRQQRNFINILLKLEGETDGHKPIQRQTASLLLFCQNKKCRLTTELRGVKMLENLSGPEVQGRNSVRPLLRWAHLTSLSLSLTH
jgi:hypothetical protein